LRTALIIVGTLVMAVAALIAVVVGVVMLVLSPLWLLCVLIRYILDAVRRRFPSNVAHQAQLAVNEAQELVRSAEREVQEEELRWFNRQGLEGAKRSLKAKQALLKQAEEALHEVNPHAAQVRLP
jgi:Na+-transporting methylmalonyl-CoA/oxaloacetate decarboxylase gamma subunit